MSDSSLWRFDPPPFPEISAFLKESSAKNFVRQPLGLLGCAVNWNLPLSFFAARRREGDISPCGATYFARVGKVGKTPPGEMSNRTTAPLALRLGPPGHFPRTPVKDNDGGLPRVACFYARRRKGVRYALLAPLPLLSRRAEISALTVQSPGLCGPCGRLTQLVRTRRAS